MGKTLLRGALHDVADQTQSCTGALKELKGRGKGIEETASHGWGKRRTPSRPETTPTPPKPPARNLWSVKPAQRHLHGQALRALPHACKAVGACARKSTILWSCPYLASDMRHASAAVQARSCSATGLQIGHSGITSPIVSMGFTGWYAARHSVGALLGTRHAHHLCRREAHTAPNSNSTQCSWYPALRAKSCSNS